MYSGSKIVAFSDNFLCIRKVCDSPNEPGVRRERVHNGDMAGYRAQIGVLFLQQIFHALYIKKIVAVAAVFRIVRFSCLEFLTNCNTRIAWSPRNLEGLSYQSLVIHEVLEVKPREHHPASCICVFPVSIELGADRETKQKWDMMVERRCFVRA